MAVQEITGKRIVKHDVNSPNFKPQEQKKVEEVNGNLKENHEEDVYGENVYKVPSEPNGNLKLEEMMSKMMGKIDKFGNRVDGGGSQTGTEAIEVDIQREIAIGMVDQNAVKSEEIKGKVNNKLDKLKKLRKRNG
jgi:hypothetical protein